MNDLLQFIYIQGDILQTFVRLFLVAFSFDCLIGFANAIKSIKGASS